MTIKIYEIHNSTLQDAPDSCGTTRMVSEADYLEALQQKDALQTSQDNIISGLGIEGDGPYSRLVLEKFIALQAKCDALAAENERAVAAVTVFSKLTEEITEIICDEIGHGRVAEILSAFNSLGNLPATDAAIAEIKAQGVDEFTTKIGDKASRLSPASNVYKVLKGVVFSGVEFAANLRAGRKG